MVLGLGDAVTVLNKWKGDSAQILVVSESPFQHPIDALGGKCRSHGLNQICQHHPQIGVPGRTHIYTKRTHSTMCTSRRTGDDRFESSRRL